MMDNSAKERIQLVISWLRLQGIITSQEDLGKLLGIPIKKFRKAAYLL